MGLKELINNQIVLFDGAMGTMLQKKGLKIGENPEVFNITEPKIVGEIHREYLKSGSNVITTNTFGANELKLNRCNLSVEEVVDCAVKIALKAKKDFKDTYAALDIGPIGELLEPMGTLSFDRAYEIFKRQIIQGEKSGADAVIIETMTDLYELKCAVLAAKENSTLPIICTMTFEMNNRTFTGCSIESMILVLEGLGVDALGVNCSLGPKELKPIVEKICSLSHIPVIVQPNAGLPEIRDGEAFYDIKSSEFAEYVSEFVDLGARIVGGCCGTTPEYIKAIYNLVNDKKPIELNNKRVSAVCTPSNVVKIDGVKIVGERINPTGKRLFKEALKNNDLDYILNQAVSQIEAGAHILDVNVGLPEIDEAEMMHNVIREIQGVLDTPLQIDSSDIKAIEAGLRYYNGKPILNSVNGEEEVLKERLPLVEKYGACVIGLTLDQNGIPQKAEERFKIAQKIVEEAEKCGIPREDVFIDCLVLTVSAQQKEVQETLKAVRLVKEKLKVKTLLGVSNISFGLPNREFINETFLALALESGLDLPIINPNSKGMMRIIDCYNVLYNHDKGAENYIEKYSNVQIDEKVVNQKETIQSENHDEIRDLKYIVIKGLREEAKAETKKLLNEKGELEIVNEYLIPALDIVGQKYEKGEIFLPQLIQCAETVKNSFEVIKANLVKNNKNTISKGKIILATVKGDIHDIGKNIVKVILENYGYQIIDLGKDVPIETVVASAEKYKVKLIGLSALMTTTLKSMEKTISELRRNNYSGKIFVGGAVLTKEYAEMIKADYYAKDAKESVEIAKRVLG